MCKKVLATDPHCRLAPTAGAAAVSVTRSSFLTRALSDQTLKAWGAPGVCNG